MDARDRTLFEKYYKPFVQYDQTYIFHHLPKKRSNCQMLWIGPA